MGVTHGPSTACVSARLGSARQPHGTASHISCGCTERCCGRPRMGWHCWVWGPRAVPDWQPCMGLGAQWCQDPAPLPFTWGRHFPQSLTENPPRKRQHTSLLLPGRCHQRKEKACGTQQRFSCGAGGKKKRRKKKEGGCPSQLIAAWHLCPRAGVQVCREQAQCHQSRWA